MVTTKEFPRALLGCLAALVLSGSGQALGSEGFDGCMGGTQEPLAVWHGTGLKQVATDESEYLIVPRDPEMMELDLGDGDDVAYIQDPPSNLTLTAGPGADRIVLCDMSELAVSIKFGDETTGGSDTQGDLLVLEPQVFLGIPDGFLRWILVFGISPQNDRIELRLPPGAEFSAEHGGARAGNVVIRVYPGNPQDRLTEGIFVVSPTDQAPEKASPVVRPALSSYDPSADCSDSDHHPGSERVDGHHVRYSQDPDVVQLEWTAGELYHDTLGGDDLVYVRSSQGLLTGVGADQVVVCALDDPMVFIGVGAGGSAADLDPDTVVIETAALQDGIRRELRLDGLSPVNDRVVLRVPEGVEPELRMQEGSAAEAVVGDLHVVLTATNWMGGGAPSTPAMFVSEPSTAVPPERAAPAEAPNIDDLVCPHPDGGSQFVEGRVETGDPGLARYSEHDDTVLIGASQGFIEHRTSDGEDRIFIVDPPAGTHVAAGRGSDVVVVCAMRSLSLSITLGDGSHRLDHDTDIVVIEPSVFLGVPQGGRRLIDIFGIAPETDRLVLRLPSGMDADVQDRRSGSVHVTVGNTLITLYRADEWMLSSLPEDAIAIEHVRAQMSPAVTTPGFAALDVERARLTCADALAEGNFARPLDAERSDIKTAMFGVGPDRILVQGEPGWIAYHTLDGDDLMVVTDTIDNTQLHLGRGSDVGLFCSTSEVSVSIDMGPHDIEPDMLIFEEASLTGVPGDFRRRYFVTGFVENNDRILLRLPPGASPQFRHGTTRNYLEATLGNTSITVVTTGDPFGAAVSPDIFLLASPTGEASTSDPARPLPGDQGSLRTERWAATSTTAHAITGDISIKENRLVFANGESITIKPVGAGRPGVYEVAPPANPVLLNGNRLCGARPITYLVMIRDGSSLYIKAFDGEEPPVAVPDPQPQAGSCATYNFESGQLGLRLESPPKRSADQGDVIQRVQARLNALGYDAGPVDGVAGRRTKRALAAFQRDRNLPTTSDVDQATLSALLASSDGPSREISTPPSREGCAEIRFQPGATSSTIDGAVPAEDQAAAAPRPACYLLAVSAGQQAQVELVSGDNVAITVPGVGEMQEKLQFATRRGTYRLEVFELLPTGRSAPFRLRVEVLPRP